MKNIEAIRRSTGRGDRTDNRLLEISRKKILSVCEHFSFRPLTTFNCLDISLDAEHSYGFGRYFDGYTQADPTDTDLPEEAFDLIICDNSYQSFDNLTLLADRLYCLMKHSGFCYFSGRANFLPGPFSLVNSAASYSQPSALKKTLSNFWIHDYTPLILENPAVFERDPDQIPGVLGVLPVSLQRRVYPRLSEFVWVLTKKK
jgi:hypothetical protein